MLCNNCISTQLEDYVEKVRGICNNCWNGTRNKFRIREVIAHSFGEPYYYIGFNKDGTDSPEIVAKEFGLTKEEFLTILEINGGEVKEELSQYPEVFYDYNDAEYAIEELTNYITAKNKKGQ